MKIAVYRNIDTGFLTTAEVTDCYEKDPDYIRVSEVWEPVTFIPSDIEIRAHRLELAYEKRSETQEAYEDSQAAVEALEASA